MSNFALEEGALVYISTYYGIGIISSITDTLYHIELKNTFDNRTGSYAASSRQAEETLKPIASRQEILEALEIVATDSLPNKNLLHTKTKEIDLILKEANYLKIAELCRNSKRSDLLGEEVPSIDLNTLNKTLAILAMHMTEVFDIDFASSRKIFEDTANEDIDIHFLLEVLNKNEIDLKQLSLLVYGEPAPAKPSSATSYLSAKPSLKAQTKWDVPVVMALKIRNIFTAETVSFIREKFEDKMLSEVFALTSSGAWPGNDISAEKAQKIRDSVRDVVRELEKHVA